jgi:lipoprotein-anchoring transpeptidase ErfK/SrfK
VDATQMRVAHSSDQIRVEVAARTLRLARDGREIGVWTVGVGAEGTPTPTGRTFLLASARNSFLAGSPVTLPLGAHSDTLDSFGGGPGTVAIHPWPDPGVFGTATSHGCVRVPDTAMAVLTGVPLGTLVLIVER